MYEYVSGRLDYIGDDYIVVDVSGLGYKIFTSKDTATKYKIGDNVKLYTLLVVKEDDLLLYGFSTREDLKMFKLLISVSGVGPKAGASLLNQFRSNEIAAAVISNDSRMLTKASGIGKKTAERIILELRDKIDAKGSLKNMEGYEISDETTQVIEALVSLGYNYNEAANVLMKIKDKNKPVDILIKEALKLLSKV